jgi:hypothetical protein
MSILVEYYHTLWEKLHMNHSKDVIIIIEELYQFLLKAMSRDYLQPFKYHQLSSKLLNVQKQSIALILRPEWEDFKLALRQIQTYPQNQYSLYFVSNTFIFAEDELLKANVIDSIKQISTIPIRWVRQEADSHVICNLGLPLSFRELYGDGNPRCVQFLCRGLFQLKLEIGRISSICGIGRTSSNLGQMIVKADPLADQSDLPHVNSKLIIVERKSDLITPFTTTDIYRDLIETFDIECKEDDLLHELEGLPFDHVCKALIKRKDQLKSNHEGVLSRDTDRMKEHWEGFKSYEKDSHQLSRHLDYGIEINEHGNLIHQKRLKLEGEMLDEGNWKVTFDSVENEILMNRPIRSILRLLCLWCLTAKSKISDDAYNHLKREFIHSYGHQYYYILKILEEHSLLGLKVGLPYKNRVTLTEQIEVLHKNEANKMAEYWKLNHVGGQPNQIVICILGGVTRQELFELRNVFEGTKTIICTTQILGPNDCLPAF